MGDRTRRSNVYVYPHKYVYRKLPTNAKYIPRMISVYEAVNKPRIPKVVVFDLDETIGHFSDLYLIWNAVFTKGIYRGECSRPTVQCLFNELLDLYPEFLRYGILHILEFIRTKIVLGESHRIYIYTNNQCDFSVWSNTCSYSPTDWVEMIIVYLNLRLNVSDTIFAKPICAFKINQQIIEPLREGTHKSHRDLLKCSVLPKTTEICFVDDAYHQQMQHDKVYYVQPPPYFHNMTRSEIIDRFVRSDLHLRITGTVSYEWMHSKMMESVPYPLRRTGNPRNDQENREIYETMMYYIKEFFCMTVPASVNSRRKRVKLGKFTRKRIRKPNG